MIYRQKYNASSPPREFIDDPSSLMVQCCLSLKGNAQTCSPKFKDLYIQQKFLFHFRPAEKLGSSCTARRGNKAFCVHSLSFYRALFSSRVSMALYTCLCNPKLTPPSRAEPCRQLLSPSEVSTPKKQAQVGWHSS